MASFTINSKPYSVDGALTPMNIAKAVNRAEPGDVPVRALAEKLRMATGAGGLDSVVSQMDAVNFGPRDYVRLFGTGTSSVKPAPKPPTSPLSGVNQPEEVPPVPLDLEFTMHGLEKEPARAASGPKRGSAKVVSGSSEISTTKKNTN